MTRTCRTSSRWRARPPAARESRTSAASARKMALRGREMRRMRVKAMAAPVRMRARKRARGLSSENQEGTGAMLTGRRGGAKIAADVKMGGVCEGMRQGGQGRVHQALRDIEERGDMLWA